MGTKYASADSVFLRVHLHSVSQRTFFTISNWTFFTISNCNSDNGVAVVAETVKSLPRPWTNDLMWGLWSFSQLHISLPSLVKCKMESGICAQNPFTPLHPPQKYTLLPEPQVASVHTKEKLSDIHLLIYM